MTKEELIGYILSGILFLSIFGPLTALLISSMKELKRLKKK
jgi:hypothetical protein